MIIFFLNLNSTEKMSGTVNSFDFCIIPGNDCISRAEIKFTCSLTLSETITLINNFIILSKSVLNNITQEVKVHEVKEEVKEVKEVKEEVKEVKEVEEVKEEVKVHEVKEEVKERENSHFHIINISNAYSNKEKILHAWRTFSSIGVHSSHGSTYYRIVFPKAEDQIFTPINPNNPVFNQHSYPCCSCKAMYYGRTLCKHLISVLKVIDIPISEINVSYPQIMRLLKIKGLEEYQWIP